MARSKNMTEERLKDIETLSVERINIERTHLEAAKKMFDNVLKYSNNEEKAQSAMGILLYITVDALLNGYKDMTTDDIIEKYHCDEMTAMLIDMAYGSFKSGVFNTRNCLISGNPKLKNVPDVSVPTKLPEGLGG